MKNIHNKGFLLFILCALIVSIGYPFFKKYYIIPLRWKKILVNEIKNNNRNVPDSLIEECSNCVYLDFKNRYGAVNNFPTRNNYNKEDKLTIVRCTIEFLIMDTAKKELARSKLDSLARQL